MRKSVFNKFKVFIGLITLLLLSTSAFAEVYVNGYTRSDGTQVKGHYRSSPNSSVQDNYSYYGNTNPHTGKKGTNKYEGSPSSEYYKGGSRSNGYNNKGDRESQNRNYFNSK